jgi:hypothetical protein
MRPVAVAVGCVVALALAGVGLGLVVNRLDWALYTLVRDLPWAAFALWAGLLVWSGLASASSAVRRAGLPLGRLLDPSPWPRVAHRVWVVLVVLTAAAALLPSVLRPSPRGVSLGVGQSWSAAGPEVPGRAVPSFAFRGASPPRAERPLSVVLTGWTYAPLSGPYHFELASYGDALVEIDDRPLLGLGQHGATLVTNWVTDPSGARRAQVQLETGFHRVRLLYRQPDAHAHAALRWLPPYHSRPRQIPLRYLLPDGTSPDVLQGRTWALTGQRVGIVLLVSLLVVRLAGIARRLGSPVVARLGRAAGSRRPGRMPTGA